MGLQAELLLFATSCALSNVRTGRGRFLSLLQDSAILQSCSKLSKALVSALRLCSCSKMFKGLQSPCICSKTLQLFEERKWVGGMKPNPPRSPTTFAAWQFVSTSSLDFLDQTVFSQIPTLGICLCYFCLTWLSFGAANIKETGV